MHKCKIVAIVQARMGSTRLPGKVLKDIEGKPMLWHIVNRLKHAKLIDKIVIATSVNKKDEAIEKFCKENNIDCFRGNEEDVLARYYETAKEYNADIIIRITSDCPLIDPEIVDLVVRRHKENSADYTSNTLKRTYPRGLDTEVFGFYALEEAYKRAKELYQREHVTPFIYEHPELFKLQNVENNKDLSYLRFTVDEEKDLELVRKIYKRLFNNKKNFYLQDIMVILKREPFLIEMNKSVKQKSLI